MKQSTAILVTGMHRSGTSATAGALGLAGVALGRNLLPPGGDNPKGYFENERAVAINERLLTKLGSRWDDVRELPDGWTQGESARDALGEIEALLDTEFNDAPLWALKDPRLCRLMPIWLEALRVRDVNTTALFVVRNPAEVAASIQARNGWEPALGELLWLRYMLEAEVATRGVARTAIAYEALLKDPLSSLRVATARIGIKLPRPKPDAMQAFVDPADRHQRYQRQRKKGAKDGPFTSIAAEVHHALEQIAQGGDAWGRIDAAHDDFTREWARFGRPIDAVATMAAGLAAQIVSAREEAAQAASDLHAQMEWARGAVEKQEELLVENARLKTDLSSQIGWSEAAVKEREALQAAIAQVRSDLLAQMAWSEAAVKEREALQAENAKLRSELTAQVAWAESATRRHEEQLHDKDRLREESNVELARVRSDLLAQIAWARQAVQEREALQAELARVRSDLAAQLDWSEQAVLEREGLQAELARVRSDLAAQLAWSEQAVREREGLQTELAQVRSDLTAQLAWSEQAMLTREQLQARETALRAELAAQASRAEAALANWHQRSLAYEQAISDAQSLGEEYQRMLAGMKGTLSWRITRPFRVMADMFKKETKGNRQT